MGGSVGRNEKFRELKKGDMEEGNSENIGCKSWVGKGELPTVKNLEGYSELDEWTTWI